MTILPSDIKLLESERMRDTPDGGGRMTGRVIPSGEAGNIFPKVSRVDAVYGRVNLRKIYIAVRTATLDMYAGAHAIITEPPENDRISCVLFSTGSAFDTRAAARDRIESYVVAGPLSRMRLYGNQLVGQKAILCYQPEGEPLPDVGDVLVLSVEPGSVRQYVRLTDVAHEVRTFTDNVGDYRRRVLTLKIGSSLQQTFTGAEVSRYSTDNSPTKVRVTQVADASRYYGLQPLTEDGELGATALRLASVYAPLVPSTQRETGVSLAEMSGSQQTPAAADVRIDATAGSPIYLSTSGVNRFYVGRSIQPGSIRARRSSSWPVRSDDGAGLLVIDGADTIEWRFQVNYEEGWFEGIGGYTNAQINMFEYLPAPTAAGSAHTLDIPVTLGTRGTVYTPVLSPLPAPGALIVDFRALGRWYRLRDNGAGQLVANDPSEGTGSVDYVTGAVIVTLGALPDVGSSVIVSWGSPAHYAIRAGVSTDAETALRLDYTMGHAPIVPGSVTISYPVGGNSRNVTDPGANGNLTGTGVSGTIDYATGAVTLLFTAPPDRAAVIGNAYTWRDGAGLYSGTTATVSGGQFTVPGTAPFRNGGTMTFATAGGPGSIPVYITSGGQVRVRRGKWLPSGWQGNDWEWSNQQVGTFDAGTGVVTLTSSIAAARRVWVDTGPGASGWPTGEWQNAATSWAVTGVADIAVERDTEAFDPQAVSGEQISPSQVGLQLDLTATVGDAVVPGSVMFRATGKTYVDRNGTLYADLDPTTGAGMAAGSIDYATGVATLTWWGDNVALNRVVDACLTQYGEFTATEVYFRTAGSPLRPGSLYVQATTIDGDLISATADQSGNISGPWMRGTVEQSMGVVRVEFGQEVASEWQAREILPGTLRYSCVVLTNLPLEASILGLDPVRLPMDGRVPIYRPADMVVVHNTQRTTLPDPVTAGQTYDVGRTDCAVIVLEDAAGDELAADRYVADLAAGTVTIAADWNGAGVAQPLVAVHRIEHMSLLADVQINGQVELTDALQREFPAEGTYVSSALIFGSEAGGLQAYVTSLFDQQSWTSVWSDSLIGSQANAQYDDINFPVEILNESAVTERWRIHFTSTTAFQVFGENLGLIATGNTSTDLAPINPVTGEAYFVLRAAGWGGGWATGNNMRFNTVGANGPVWIARTILAGATLAGDRFHLEARGDVDVE